MNTYLGACQNLTEEDVDAGTVAGAGIVYLEGYLWDPPAAKDAFRKAADLAHRAGGRVALTLSDPFCVDRYRDEFLQLLRSGLVDILFANQHELKSLYVAADLDAAVAALRAEAGSARFLGIVTRSEEGALAVTRSETVAAPAHPVETVVDTTGAGDLFAAGVLHGLSRNRPLGNASGSARWRRRRSSAISARVRRPTSGTGPVSTGWMGEREANYSFPFHHISLGVLDQNPDHGLAAIGRKDVALRNGGRGAVDGIFDFPDPTFRANFARTLTSANRCFHNLSLSQDGKP